MTEDELQMIPELKGLPSVFDTNAAVSSIDDARSANDMRYDGSVFEANTVDYFYQLYERKDLELKGVVKFQGDEGVFGFAYFWQLRPGYWRK